MTTGENYKYRVKMLGGTVGADTLGDILVAVFQRLEGHTPGTLAKLATAHKRLRRKRPIVARSPLELYPGRPDLADNYLKVTNGWYVATNRNCNDCKIVLITAGVWAGLKETLVLENVDDDKDSVPSLDDLLRDLK